jgi:flagella basal body P-ring formation protein FlgA
MMNTLRMAVAAFLLAASMAATAASPWVDTDLSGSVQEALHELESQLAADLGLEDVSVQLLAGTVKAPLPPGQVSAHLRGGRRPASPTFRARLQPWVEIRVDGVLRRTLAIPVQVTARRRVLQATRAIAVGEALGTGNTQAELHDAAESAEALDATELRPGHRTTEAVAAGAMVLRHAVRDGSRAMRGTVVPVVFRLAAVEVQAPGTLLDDEAREGQAVRVRLPRLAAPVRAQRVQGQFVAIEDTGSQR